ncbi:glycoside hydrolase family 31 [Beutenbergia cavernae DSM 12333]|uniref:alpha-D-xyloside xylohydrolase n=1 Tax=Beutenbergia cavernae (strain ATCC BAA-8 / DSM 12333 / CCUG 43141 / JCM 11478 / NBRC 16432 / NCIMB 13614 / HKI 0122) TaxID=471853 RepID=C5C1W4_BEUC1|nr:alpha-xylosidase [Beutenbergia cavernae]ACQ79582.1 glycoside hydrolase family 31 [Beutenbergia cavernae DSM 12333]
MKFTDGYWQLLPGVTELRPRHVDDVVAGADTLTVFASTAPITKRGDTLNRPLITVTFHSPMDDVIGVTIEHFTGGLDRGPHFALRSEVADVKVTTPQLTGRPVATLRSGGLEARIATEGEWSVDFVAGDRTLTSSTPRSVGVLTDADGHHHVREQLTLGVGEHVYGLGERFGALVKNGQRVDIWNADGGTASDQAYKNVPFYVTNRGYGVVVDAPERVSYEIGTEVVSRAQFSVEGQRLTYYIVNGPTPKDVLRRYTALTGRPARVPDWSYGLWLSTSFTTDYDEATVTHFVDGMAARDLPLSVFHFDCFWMRQFHWSDFVWDPATFPDPEGMLARLKAKGLRICVWINPYIAQRSALFTEGKDRGYLVRNPDGSVWQWNLWQAGMGLVDFTNPQAREWYVDKLRVLLGQGVDCFKTDFGERIPTDVVWHDGSDPQRMHNYYTHLYNEAVFSLLEAERGEGEAVLFARSATLGGQQFPVHWGGDCESTFVSMAESLRGGLSLALSGFGFWSHDIGGFEGVPDAAVFKRWVPFGLLSSHSRLHGSDSYRVPWAFDDEAVEVTRRFTHLKHALMPYLSQAGYEAHTDGIPVMRPMVLEFPDDPGAAVVETQYLLGANLLVAPVFSADGDVDVYVPEGTWTSLLSGASVTGPRWVRERHEFDSLPLYVRPDSVLPIGARTDRPDYDHADGVTLLLTRLADGHASVTRVAAEHGDVAFTVTRTGSRVRVEADGAAGPWHVQVGDAVHATPDGATSLELDRYPSA